MAGRFCKCARTLIPLLVLLIFILAIGNTIQAGPDPTYYVGEIGDYYRGNRVDIPDDSATILHGDPETNCRFARIIFDPSNEIIQDKVTETIPDSTCSSMAEGDDITLTGGTYEIPSDAPLGGYDVFVQLRSDQCEIANDYCAELSYSFDVKELPEIETIFYVQKKSSMDAYSWFSGEPIEDAVISIGGETKITDADGQATFGLKKGSYDFTVQKNNYETLSDSLQIHSTSSGTVSAVNVELVTSGMGVLELKVRDRDGNRIAANKYRILVDGEERNPDESGKLLIGEGSHSVTLKPAGGVDNIKTITETAEIYAGKRSVLTLEPEKPSTAKQVDLQYQGNSYSLLFKSDNSVVVQDGNGARVGANEAKDLLRYRAFTEEFSYPSSLYSKSWWNLTKSGDDFELLYWANSINEVAITGFKVFVKMKYGGTVATEDFINAAEEASRLFKQNIDGQYSEFAGTINRYTKIASTVYETSQYPSSRLEELKQYCSLAEDAYSIYQSGGASDIFEAISKAGTTGNGGLTDPARGLIIELGTLPLDDAKAGLKLSAQESFVVNHWSKTQKATLDTLANLTKRRENGRIGREEMRAYFVAKHGFISSVIYMLNQLENLNRVGKEQSLFFDLASSFYGNAERIEAAKETWQWNYRHTMKQWSQFSDRYSKLVSNCQNVNEDPGTSEITMKNPISSEFPSKVRVGDSFTVHVESDGRAVGSASVSVGAFSEVTDSSGNASLSIDSNGVYNLTVNKKGYRQAEGKIRVQRSKEVMEQPFRDVHLGKTEPGKVYEVTRKMENRGNRDILMDTYSTSSTAVSPVISSTRIRSGKELTVDIKVNTGKLPTGEFVEEVVLKWSEPVEGKTSILITGKVPDREGTMKEIEIPSSGWNMVSLPFTPVNKAPGKIFSQLGNPSQVFQWDTSNQEGKGRYLSPGNGLDHVSPLQGMWVRADVGPRSISVLSTGNKRKELELPQKGWHQVGVPAPVIWSQVGVQKGENGEILTVEEQAKGPAAPHWMSRFLWKWKALKRNYFAFSADNSDVELKPGEGYWVKTYVDNLYLDFSHGRTSSSSEKEEFRGVPTWRLEGNVEHPPPPPSANGGHSLPALEVKALPNPALSERITFRASGREILASKLKVFDSSGRIVHSTQFRHGEEINWDLVDNRGTPVGNGVYLFQLSAKVRGNKTLKSSFKKLIILR